MAFLAINNVKISGMAACVPSTNDSISEVYKWNGADNFLSTTGIKARRRSMPDQTTSDFCYAAAERLINDLGWEKAEIDALVFVTQTPDYITPATSAILQQRLGLPSTCYTLDISLGCSGWVYALSVISSLMQNGTIRKGLLLAGDTLVKVCSLEDKGTFPLFGDAGTATALEYNDNVPPINYVFNTDGEGYDAIIIHDGGYRNPITENSLKFVEEGDGSKRAPIHLTLDGMSVFSFGITKAPKSVRQLSEHFGIDLDSVDLFTFHQANMMMNEKIRKKLKLPEEKVPYSMDEFANTSCASIPLTLVTREAGKLRNGKLRHVACGFGVGLSWGSAYFETDRICVPDLIEI